MKVLAENKKAYFDYEILEKFEAGLALIGQEVKSIKTRGLNMAGTYVVIQQSRAKKPEFYWVGANIPPYQPNNAPAGYEPQRFRKLLLRKEEIQYLIGKSKQRGLTMVPLKVYTNDSIIKLEFALVRGKKKADKRETIKKREADREIRRAIKGNF